MNTKNTREKTPIHENADANITCDFGDGDISRLGVAYLTYVYIHNYLDYIKFKMRALLENWILLVMCQYATIIACMVRLRWNIRLAINVTVSNKESMHGSRVNCIRQYNKGPIPQF